MASRIQTRRQLSLPAAKATVWGPLFFIILFVSISSVALVYLPPGFGAGLVVGLLFFLFTLIRPTFGLFCVVLAMFFSPELSIGETLHRSVTLRVEDFLIPALAVAWAIRQIWSGHKQMFRPTALNWPIYSYAFFLLLSTLWGILSGYVEPKTAIFYYLKVLEFFMVFLLTVNILQDEKSIQRFLLLFLVLALLMGIYGVSQIWTMDRISTPFEGENPEPNTLGGLLTMVIAITLSILLYAPGGKAGIRLLAFWVLFTSFVSLLFTLSRASFIGFVFMLGIMALFTRRVSLVFLIVFMLLFAPFLMPEEVIDRVNYTFSGPAEAQVSILGLFSINVDTSTYERIEIWQKVQHLFITNFPISTLFGYGITAEHILDSQFARLLVEVGLIGTVLFVWIMVRIFFCAWRVFKNTPNWTHKAFALGYLASFFGLIVHSMGTITFYIVRIMEPFWFLTAIIVFIYLQLEKEQREAKSRAAPAPAAPEKVRWIYSRPDDILP